MVKQLFLFGVFLPAISAAQLNRLSLVGTWELVSRIQRDSTGNLVEEPSLGSDPIGYLVYDASGRVFAQLMSRHRPANPFQAQSPSEPNDPAHIGGYDAYFGHFEVDSAGSTVRHIVDGSLIQSDVGRTLVRRVHLQGDTLRLQYDIRGKDTGGGTRTLTWHRISP